MLVMANVIFDEEFMRDNCEWNFYKSQLEKTEMELRGKGLKEEERKGLKKNIEDLNKSIKNLENSLREQGLGKSYFRYYDDPVAYDKKNETNFEVAVLHDEILRNYEGFFGNVQIYKAYLEIKHKFYKGYIDEQYVYEDSSEELLRVRESGLARLRKLVNDYYIDARLNTLKSIAEKYPIDLLRSKVDGGRSDFDKLKVDLEDCKTPEEIDALFTKKEYEYNNLDYRRGLLAEIRENVKDARDPGTRGIVKGFMNPYRLYDLKNKAGVDVALQRTITDLGKRNQEIQKDTEARLEREKILDEIFAEWDRQYKGLGSFVEHVVDECKEILKNYPNPKGVQRHFENSIGDAIRWQGKLFKFLDKFKKNKLLSCDIPEIESKLFCKDVLDLYLASTEKQNLVLKELEKEMNLKARVYGEQDSSLRVSLIEDLNNFFDGIDMDSSINFKEKVNSLAVLREVDYNNLKKSIIDEAMMANIEIVKKEYDKKRKANGNGVDLITNQGNNSRSLGVIGSYIVKIEGLYKEFSDTTFFEKIDDIRFKNNYNGLMHFVKRMARQLKDGSIFSEMDEYGDAYGYLKELIDNFVSEVTGPELLNIFDKSGTSPGRH